MKISNWGKYPVIDADVHNFTTPDQLKELVGNNDHMIARGLGRCYGDSALDKNIISTLHFNRILSFDEESGEIWCESGVSLSEILEIFVPGGWFLSVTPGTKFVTVGGAVASDVHGKNHHMDGCFCDHVISIEIMLADGSVVECSREVNPNLFWATCGGMGLTGIILSARFRLIRIETPQIVQETVKAANLDEIIDVFAESEDVRYSVAWIDCLTKGKNQGRSVMMRGEFAHRDEVPKHKQELKVPGKLELGVPVNFPKFILNKWSMKSFNALYYGKAPRGTAKGIVDYETFFYPLDSIHNWNRIYGNRGFTQYQFVLPEESSKEGMKTILDKISDSGQGSFLAVLKVLGKQKTLIGYPIEGLNLALDFAIKPKLFPLLDELDRIVLDHGGRLYLTKDVRMSAETFESGYSNSTMFKILKKELDKENKFRSLQSQRLKI